MKKILPLLCLLITLFATAQSGPFYVAAKTGLSIREKPELGARVLDKIPYGTKVVLINTDEEKKTLVVEGMECRWEKVKYNNKTGYIIDAYLFPWPPPKAATVKELKNYLAQVSVPYAPKQVIKSGTMQNIMEGGWELQKQLYKNGAEHHKFLGYEYGSDTYFLPGFTLQQGFLLLRLVPEFSNVIGEKDEFPSTNKKYKKGEIEYEVTLQKRIFDAEHSWLERIKIEYADGAVYVFEMYTLDTQLVIFYGSGL